MATLKLRYKGHDNKLRVQIDSGATVDVLPLKTYKQLRREKPIPRLEESEMKLRVYYSGDYTNPVGQCTAILINGEIGVRVTFQVVDLPEQPLLSAATAVALGCITLGTNVEFVDQVQHSTSHQNRLKLLVQEFDDVFKGLGRLEGDVRMHLKENSKPVQCPPRKIPVALKEDIVERVRQLKDQGVITPVHGPSEWIRQMLVVAREGRKLRVTLDPYHLNRASRRAHYPLPALSDVLPRLAKAKFFSVADASDGFFQCVLEEESTDRTTFWTPLGRYKYFRAFRPRFTRPNEWRPWET